jgi:hypothetical protein
MRRWMVVFLAVLSVALVIPAGLWAQAGATGAITGTVLDQKGGAIAGATVVVVNAATGQKERQVVSTGAERSIFPACRQALTASKSGQPGFQDFLLKRFLFK